MITISINPLIFIGPFTIRWSILIVWISIGIGVWLTAHEAERKGIKKGNVYGVAIWIVVAGIVGARLFYVINLWSFEFAANPVWSLYIFHDWGFDIWGAVIGVLVAAVLVCWHRRWRFPVFLDEIPCYTLLIHPDSWRSLIPLFRSATVHVGDVQPVLVGGHV